MTIKTRNRILLVFFTISLLILTANIIQFVYASFHNGITPPLNPIRNFVPFKSWGPFAYNFNAAIIGCFAFCVYVSSVSIIIYATFEKTQSIEVIYFTLFLFGCIFESLRLLIAEFSLWQTYSNLLISIGKSIIGGRILAPLSLFFAAIFSESSQRQNVERNILMLIVVSIGLSVLYPLNTLYTTSTCAVAWGYSKLFFIVRLFILLATLVTMIFNAVNNNSKTMIRSIIGFVLLASGYLILIGTDCFFNLFLGIGLLSTGTVLYLRSTHLIYMWN